MATTHERIEALLKQADELCAELIERHASDPALNTTLKIGSHTLEDGHNAKDLSRKAVGYGLLLAALAEVNEERTNHHSPFA